MKKFIIAIAFIILGVFLVNTFIMGNDNSMRSEGQRIGNNMINNVKEIEKNGTVYTP